MENEIWKDIEGYEGIYQVSNLGRIRSLDRYITKPQPRNGVPTRYFQRGTVIVCHVNRNGYVGVMLKVGGNKKNFIDNLMYADAMDKIHAKQRKPIVQMTMDGEYIREWPSMHAVHLALGLDTKSLAGACRQRYGTKTCGGYRWKFKE